MGAERPLIELPSTRPTSNTSRTAPVQARPIRSSSQVAVPRPCTQHSLRSDTVCGARGHSNNFYVRHGLPGTPLLRMAALVSHHVTQFSLRGNPSLDPMVGEGVQQLWNLLVTLDAAERAPPVGTPIPPIAPDDFLRSSASNAGRVSLQTRECRFDDIGRGQRFPQHLW